MAFNSFVSNQGTQTSILTDNTGGTAGTVIAVQKVDISPQGTAGSLWDGNVGVSSGTLTSLPNIPGGTLALVTRVGNVGTLEVGTINSLPNLPQGSINVTAGTIATLGTMGTLGLVNTVTTVSNITNGSIRVTAGTEVITSGSISVIAGTVNAGTIDLIKAGTVTRLEGGSIVVTAGSITSSTPIGAAVPANAFYLGVNDLSGNLIGLANVQKLGDGNSMTQGLPVGTWNLNGSSIWDRARGIVNATNSTGTGIAAVGLVAQFDDTSPTAITENQFGNVRMSANRNLYNAIRDAAGNERGANVDSGNHLYVRHSPTPTAVTLSYGTTTTGTIGTLVAAPSAGSAIFITALDINVQSGTVEPLVSFNLATGGQGVITRGNYAAGGGIAKTFAVPNSANNTGTALTFNILSGSGTVSYNVAYFIAVP